MIETTYDDVKYIRDIESAAVDLYKIGLLNDKKHEKVQQLLDRRRDILHRGNLASSEAGKQIAAAAERVVSTDDGDPVSEAASVVQWEVAERIAVSAAKTAADQARGILNERRGEIPATLNDLIDDAVEQLKAASEALDGVHDAQSAIDAGKVEQWQQFTQMRQTIPAIHAIAFNLRSAGLLWRPAPIDQNHWATTYQREPAPNVPVWELHPYVPANREEFTEAQRWRYAPFEGRHIREHAHEVQNV